MAVKYYCPLCGRRFVDWGAEKLQYKCPSETCNEEPLIKVGETVAEPEAKPDLKRTKKRKQAATPSALDIVEMDSTFIESDDVDEDEEGEDVEEEAEETDSPVVVATEDDDSDTDDALLVDDDDVDSDDDDTFADALDIGADDPDKV